MIEQTIAIQRYNDLQAAYQDCHQKLLDAERKADQFRGDTVRLSRKETELEKQLTSARSLNGKPNKEQADEIAKLKETGRCLQEDCSRYWHQIVALDMTIKELKWEKDVAEVQADILRVNYKASATDRSILQRACQNWDTAYSGLECRLQEERLKKLPLYKVIGIWFMKMWLA